MFSFFEKDSASPILAFFVLFYFLWKFLIRNEKSSIDEIPGPRPYPFVGNVKEALVAREAMLDEIMKRRKRFGPIFKLRLGSLTLVALSQAEYVEIFLRGAKHLKKAEVYKFTEPWLGTGLLTSAGQKWHSHRKLITPTFHFGILQNFLSVFQENANILVNKLEEKASSGEEFDIFPMVTLCTLDIICETAMGTKINAQLESQSEYVKSVYSLSAIIVERMSRPWLHPDLIFYMTKMGRRFRRELKIVQGFTEEVIKARKKALRENKNVSNENSEKRKSSFLDLLLEASADGGKTQITDLELREEVDTFMFEGHDTTAAGINWTLFLLGNHPEIQEKVYQEISSVLGDDFDGFLTTKDMGELKLLERTIKESLRLYPSVPTIGRVLEEDVQIGEYLVPKGVGAQLNIYVLHRDPKYFPDPEKFDPDRFLPENSTDRHPFAYLPFSAGPRNCIGQKFALLEEKVILSILIKNFKFESLKKPEEIKKFPELILRPLDGIKMKIRKR